jgi:hypothetical protein
LTNIIEHNRRRIVDEQVIGRSRDGGIGATTATVVVSETKGGCGVGDDDKNEFTFGNDRALMRNNSARKNDDDDDDDDEEKKKKKKKRTSLVWT